MVASTLIFWSTYIGNTHYCFTNAANFYFDNIFTMQHIARSDMFENIIFWTSVSQFLATIRMSKVVTASNISRVNSLFPRHFICTRLLSNRVLKLR